MNGFGRAALLIAIFSASGCGGGGGGGGGSNASSSVSSQPQPPQGSLAITDVDVDDDGLIEIATLEQLDWMRNDLAGTSLKDKESRVNAAGCRIGGCNGYELVADLNFDTNGDGVMDSRDAYFDYDKDGTNAGWLPIRGEFTANFNGNGRRISNLYINRPTSTSVGIGLIGNAVSLPGRSQSIANIILDGALASVSGNGSAGGLNGAAGLVGVVYAQGVTTIANNQVRLPVTTSTSYAAALLGIATITQGQLVLNGNQVQATVSAQGYGAGALAGRLFANTPGTTPSATVTNNTSSGAVSSKDVAGGLIGTIGGLSLTLDNSSSTANVTTDQLHAGGLIGSISDFGAISISRSNASGAVTSVNGYTGGLVGVIYSQGSLNNTTTIDKSWSTSPTTSGNYVGGLIGYISAAHGKVAVRESFAKGTVKGVFTVSGNTVSGGGGVGGLIGYISGESDGQATIESVYSNSEVNGASPVGGLIGGINLTQNSRALVRNAFSASGITAYFIEAGGLIGRANSLGNSSFNIENTYTLGLITNTNPDPMTAAIKGGLMGLAYADNIALLALKNSYWAQNTTGAMSDIGSTGPNVTKTQVVGASLTSLSCPTAPNNMSCAASELYHDWGTAVNSGGEAAWRFSNPGRLPALRFDGNFHQPAQDSNGKFVVARE